MKTPEEMAEYFRSMPSKRKPNPYWKFRDGLIGIPDDGDHALRDAVAEFLPSSVQLLGAVREFFRRYYESFGSEAQVLCVTPNDCVKLISIGMPILGGGKIGPYDVVVMVLPQDNHMGTSVVSERFWNEQIAGNGIVPVARIHSHHVLEPYQSGTDYASLNSGTLEMVMGRIMDEALNLCYWLDVPGTDIKAQTFLALEDLESKDFTVVPHAFNGPLADRGHVTVYG